MLTSPAGEGTRGRIRKPLTEDRRRLCLTAYKIACYIGNRFGRYAPWLASELVAEALFGAVVAAADYVETRGAAFTTYATLVIRHRLIRLVQSNLRRTNLNRQEEDDVPELRCPRSIDPAVAAEALDQWALIAEFLPARQATALRLRFIEGLDLDEIGNAIGASRTRAGQIIDKALDRCFHILRDLNDIPEEYNS